MASDIVDVDVASALAHELKNPLTAVVGLGSLLSRTHADDPEVAELARHIRAASHAVRDLGATEVRASPDAHVAELARLATAISRDLSTPLAVIRRRAALLAGRFADASTGERLRVLAAQAARVQAALAHHRACDPDLTGPIAAVGASSQIGPARAPDGGGPPMSHANPTGTILVVDDEPSVRFTLVAILEEEGLAVIEAENGRDALRELDRHPEVDLVISDLRMPEIDGLALLDHLRSRSGAPPLVMITAHGSERTAVEAVKRGALDYFRKPFEAEEVVHVVRRTLAAGALAAENRRLKARLHLAQSMVFASRPMNEVAEIVERVARRDVTVLVVGETGTGKELIARAIVAGSTRAAGPFVKLNCAAVPRELIEAELFGHAKGAFTGAVRERKGLFREAHGGTLFLDEVNSLDPQAQGALLRVLQEREVRPVGEDRATAVDVRLIAASNRPLEEDPSFRKDLFYRLNVISVRLPPLRERPEDIEPLVRHFAALYGARFGFDHIEIPPDVMARLQRAPWSGNVRELEHTIERLLALSLDGVLRFDLVQPPTTPSPSDSPSALVPVPGLSLKDQVDAYERGIIAATLGECRGNRSETARRLDVDRGTLLSKMKKFGLE